MTDTNWTGPDPPEGYEPPAVPKGLRRVDRVPDDVDASDVEARYHSPDSGSDDEDDEEDDEDKLDGMCDLDFEMAPRTDDSEAAALALFASTEFLDAEAVEEKRAEWVALFGEGGPP